ncbi:alpha-glucosidase [Catalinimonas alkaloidigena]|uniref:glycoside hydrolase family 97 protein n=1 Tax=Catalinimonas alkaloidigena TaxID=1075417 RepID=UPI002405A3B2|nr:glycoside hydrolase family 97 protein [Catalinimonas alkaloidigena]MDF9799411.1 alpha-glucosidase [Catalinimonas alkaloidigena]
MKVLLSLIVNLSICISALSQSISVSSPNNQLSFYFDVQNPKDGRKGVMYYHIKYNEQTVILPSELGIVMKEGIDWTENIKFKDSHTSSVDTVWHPIYGERSEIPDQYNELILNLSRADANAYELQLIVRAYNEGIAFQYHWPEKHNSQHIWIEEENTQFNFPNKTQAWYTPRAQATYDPVLIKEWERPAEMPLTLSLPDDLYACVAEAHMVNYARSRLMTVNKKENALVTTLAGEILETSPFSTPWRVVMVAEEVGKLLEHNYLILNLNPPNAIENPWWIKPGKAIRETTLSTEGAKNLVDFAKAHGLDYIHFDAGWYGYEYVVSSDATTVTVDPRRNPKGDLDLKEAIRYAKSKGLGVTVYVNHRALEKQLDEILPLYKAWGVDGVKYGFVHVGTHRWTNWLYDAVRKAAENQLMVNIHDEFRPTGYSRTYPNLMTQEGILGNEGMPDARHNTILPFTRFVAGAADYTPAYYHRKGFKNIDRYIQNTPAHQLALPVIYYSPLQWLYWYDVPSRDYQGEPEVEFWANCPTVWDETKVLQGEIGEYIVTARKKDDDWYLGAITNTQSREVDLSFDFLPEKTSFVAHIYSDGGETIKTRTHVKIERKIVNAKTNIQLKLKESGGLAIRMVPATPNDMEKYAALD